MNLNEMITKAKANKPGKQAFKGFSATPSVQKKTLEIIKRIEGKTK